MKKSIYKNIFLATVIIVAAYNSQAQQKASDRPMGAELKKVRDMQQARSKTLEKTQEAATTQQPAVTNIPANKTKESPAKKTSTQPMIAPTRPKKQG